MANADTPDETLTTDHVDIVLVAVNVVLMPMILIVFVVGMLVEQTEGKDVIKILKKRLVEAHRADTDASKPADTSEEVDGKDSAVFQNPLNE